VRNGARKALLGLALTLPGCPGNDTPPGELSGDPTKGGPPPRDPWADGEQPTGSSSSSGVSPTGTGEPGTDSSGAGSSTGADTGVDTDASSSTPPTDGCGDGVVQPPEQCDESYANNSDVGACTQTCMLAVCGDGLVWAGMKKCDHAEANNNSAYDGCTEACVFGPRCGDGVLQPEFEECDGVDAEGMAACTPGTCRIVGRLAFATSVKVQGSIGGLAQADKICRDAALAAGLDNASKFKAWLSDGVLTAKQRLANAAADPGYPYARRGGMLLADDLDDLIASGPRLPLDVDEFGATLPPEELAWTNLDLVGQPFSAVNHCMEWTDASVLAKAMTGRISPASESELPAWKTDSLWSSDSLRSCIGLAHLYCFED
jgi:hypothetical protein